MNVFTLVVGPIYENCHVLYDDSADGGNRAIIVDPGADGSQIIDALNRRGLAPQAILLTHAHVDHIGAVPELVRRYRIPVWVHPLDRPMYSSSANELMPYLPHVRNLPAPMAEGVPQIPGMPFCILHTPGHTPGSCCFHFAEAGICLTGDTLFCGGVGRTDLPGGSQSALERSLREVLAPLPQNTVIYPGHGESSTIGNELGANPDL